MDNNLPLYLFHQGTNYQAYKFFGSHKTETEDKWVFRVYAPNAKSVSVVGDFNGWDNNAAIMNKIPGGVWEIELDGIKVYDAYKYCITKPDGKDRYPRHISGLPFSGGPHTPRSR